MEQKQCKLPLIVEPLWCEERGGRSSLNCRCALREFLPLSNALAAHETVQLNTLFFSLLPWWLLVVKKSPISKISKRFKENQTTWRICQTDEKMLGLRLLPCIFMLLLVFVAFPALFLGYNNCLFVFPLWWKELLEKCGRRFTKGRSIQNFKFKILFLKKFQLGWNWHILTAKD